MKRAVKSAEVRELLNTISRQSQVIEQMQRTIDSALAALGRVGALVRVDGASRERLSTPARSKRRPARV